MAAAAEQEQNQVIFYQDGRLINEFYGLENREVIGDGGFGTVIRAQHKIDRKFYAIKMIELNGLKLYLP